MVIGEPMDSSGLIIARRFLLTRGLWVSLIPLLTFAAAESWAEPATMLLASVWILVAWFVIRQSGQEGVAPSTRRMIGHVAVVCGLLAMLVGTWFLQPKWGIVATALFLLGIGLSRWPQQSVLSLVGWGILCLLPGAWPARFDMRLVEHTERWATSLASGIWDLLGVLHVVSAGIIHTEHFSVRLGTLGGPVSAPAVLAVAIAMCLLLHRSFLHTLLLCAGTTVGLVWSLAIGVLLAHFWSDVTGAPVIPDHLWWWRCGVGIATIGFGITADQFLRHLLAPVPVGDPSLGHFFGCFNALLLWPHPVIEHSDEAQRPSVGESTAPATWEHRFAVALTACALGVAPIATFAFGLEWFQRRAIDRQIANLPVPEKQLAPSRFEDWELVGFVGGPSVQSGRPFASWEYRWDALPVRIQLHAGGPRWDARQLDPTLESWRISARRTVYLSQTGNSSPENPALLITLHHHLFGYSYSLLMARDLATGEPIAPRFDAPTPTPSNLAELLRGFRENRAANLAIQSMGVVTTGYQMQDEALENWQSRAAAVQDLIMDNWMEAHERSADGRTRGPSLSLSALRHPVGTISS